MLDPPPTLDGAGVLFVADVSHLEPTGRTHHTIGGEDIERPMALAIAAYDDATGYYLFYCDHSWHVLTDALHESVEDAAAQAVFEFGPDVVFFRPGSTITVGTVSGIPVVVDDAPGVAARKSVMLDAALRAQARLSVEELLEGMEVDDWRERHEVVDRLAARAADDPRTVPSLLRHVRDDAAWQVRDACVMALGRWSPDGETAQRSAHHDEVVATLRTATGDTVKQVRDAAEYMLSLYGEGLPPVGTVEGVDALRVGAWKWAIGDQPWEDLPGVATAALVDGLDTPALRELAGATRSDFWTVKGLFEQVLDDIGLHSIDEQTALWQLARHAASQIVNGEVSPAAGAAWIWAKVAQRIEREGDFRVFVGLLSELEDHPDLAPGLEREIVAAAEELLERREPRRWLLVQARLDEPLLTKSGQDNEHIALEDIPLSESVRADLIDLGATFADVCRLGGFAAAEDAEDFNAQGEELVARMRRELGDDWWVEYHPVPSRPPGLWLRRS